MYETLEQNSRLGLVLTMREDWYKLKIEKPIRNLVKLLRDNGFNTVCSCGHLPKPYVQMEGHYPEEVTKLYSLLVENKFKNFTILYSMNNIESLKDFDRTLEVSFTVLGKREMIRESDIRDGVE